MYVDTLELLSTGDAAESSGVNLWLKWSLFYLLWEEVSDLYTPAETYLLFCHVQPSPRPAVPHAEICRH